MHDAAKTTTIIGACGAKGPVGLGFWSCIHHQRKDCPPNCRLQCHSWARYLAGIVDNPPVFTVSFTGRLISSDKEAQIGEDNYVRANGRTN